MCFSGPVQDRARVADEAATHKMHIEFDGASIVERRHVLAGSSAGPEETVLDIELARVEGLVRYVSGV